MLVEDALSVHELGGHSLHARAFVWLVSLLYDPLSHGTMSPAVHQNPGLQTTVTVRSSVVCVGADVVTLMTVPSAAPIDEARAVALTVLIAVRMSAALVVGATPVRSVRISTVM